MIHRGKERRGYPHYQVSSPISFLSPGKLRVVETSDLTLGVAKHDSSTVREDSTRLSMLFLSVQNLERLDDI